MFHPNDRFELPPEDTKIWRYLNFTKFVGLLETRSLYFSSLARLEDRFEGPLPPASRKVAKRQYIEFFKSIPEDKHLREESARHWKHIKTINAATSPLIYANS